MKKEYVKPQIVPAGKVSGIVPLAAVAEAAALGFSAAMAATTAKALLGSNSWTKGRRLVEDGILI